MKALIIEDDIESAEFVKTCIKDKVDSVFIAETGKLAREIFSEQKPEIVFVDLKLPDEDGMDLIRHFRKISPSVAVVIITGYSDFDTTIFGLRERASDYLVKPLSKEVVDEAFQRCIKNLEKTKLIRQAPNLLIVDDETLTRTRLKKIFTEENYNVFTAADGEEAIEIFKKEKIDIVISDYRMPKKDGLTLLKEIKNITDDSEVIIYSGFGDEEIVINLIKEGAFDFLKKPIDIEQLLRTTKKAWEKLLYHRSGVYPPQ